MNSQQTLNSLPKSSTTTSKPLNPSPILPSAPSPPSNFDFPISFPPMLCSKSSNWLHRLRSSRGFPDSDHIDLEHFLSTSLHPQTSTDSISAPPDKRPGLNKPHDDNDDEPIQGGDVIDNVLSELFHMGEFQDLSKIRRKKSCRKQQCPRICVVSTNFPDVQNAPVKKSKVSERSPLPLPLTLSSRRKAKEVNRELKATECVREEEEEKGHWDLSAYSQTEVTIIDSSVPAWKFEKILYRRKNVWKVGDKKGKGLMSSDRKKRKEIVNENGDVQKKKKKKKKFKLCSSSSKLGNAEESGEKKKIKKKKLKMFNSSKNVDNEEAIVRPKSAQGHDQGKTMVAAYEKKQDNPSQLQEKSSVKKQIDGGPSVILIKSIPTTYKKDVSGISKNSVKSMQK